MKIHHIFAFLLLFVSYMANAATMAETVVVCDDVLMVARVPASGLSPAERVEMINERLDIILGCEELTAANINLKTINSEKVIYVGSHPLLTVTKGDAVANGTTVYRLAERWLRNTKATLPLARPPSKCNLKRELP